MIIFITVVLLAMAVFMYSACRVASECDREDERIFQLYLLTRESKVDA